MKNKRENYAEFVNASRFKKIKEKERHLLMLSQWNKMSATCWCFLALEFVPDDKDGGEEEEKAAQDLHTRVGQQRVLHCCVLHL
jgi:hypothetical protein